MDFTFKADWKSSKCYSCFHSHIVRPHRTGQDVTMCRLLGLAVGPVKECNQHLPISQGPVPIHLLNQAWTVDFDKRNRNRMGFKPPTPTLVAIPPNLGIDVEDPSDED